MKTTTMSLCTLLLFSSYASCLSEEKKETISTAVDQKKNILDLMRHQFDHLMNYSNKDSDVIDEYKKLMEESFNLTSQSLNALTEKHITEVNNHLKNKIMNPGPELQDYLAKCSVAGLDIGEIIREGKTITKEKIREKFSFILDFMKEQIDKHDTELIELIASLLEKQGDSKELIECIKKNTEAMATFSKENKNEIVSFMFESTIEVLYKNLSSTQKLAEAQKNNTEISQKLCDEVGMSEKECKEAEQKMQESVIAYRQKAQE